MVVICLLAGCGRQAENKQLVMWLVGSEQQALTINELSEEFTQETGIKVKCEAISWGQAHSKYLTSVVGEVAPDIGAMGLTWGTEFGSLGAMIDLNAAYPEEMKEYKNKIFPGIWEAIEYKNQVYAVPFDMSLQIMYYRSDIVKKPPGNWAELTAIIDELNEKDKGMIFGWGSLNWLGYAPFLWQAGGDFYNQAHTSSALDSEEAVRSLDYCASLYTEHKVPITAIPMEQGMRTGDYPLCIDGNWKINTLLSVAPEIKGKWSIATLPKGPSGKKTAFIGGRVMGIFEQSDKKDAAWEFIKFLSQPEIQLRIYEAATETFDTYLPPNLATWEILPMEDHFSKVLMEQAMDAKGPPSVLGWDDSTRFIDVAVQEAVLNLKDPALLLEKTAEELDKRIE